MTDQESGTKTNVILGGVGVLQTQCVQQCSVLYIKYVIYAKYAKKACL